MKTSEFELLSVTSKDILAAYPDSVSAVRYVSQELENAKRTLSTLTIILEGSKRVLQSRGIVPDKFWILSEAEQVRHSSTMNDLDDMSSVVLRKYVHDIHEKNDYTSIVKNLEKVLSELVG